MTYDSEPIARAVEDINTQYLLPAIQREFVWSRNQIVRLFDSLLRDYPIGSFLFWHIPQEDKDNYVKYEFIKKYITDDRYIETTAQTRNSITDADGLGDVTLVLDGQQRLSSLFIGLRGTYTDKQKYKYYSNPDAWRQRRLYLNLLLGDSETAGESRPLHYEFRFRDDDARTTITEQKYWFRAGQILDVDDDKELDRLAQSLINDHGGELDDEDRFAIRHNIQQLYRAVHKEEYINYYEEDTQDLDRVLEIFIRTNEGGTQLSKSDLLLSLATATWDKQNAREEITTFVDTLNKQLDKSNDFNKDFVLKACLVLSDLPVRYRISSFTKENVTTIEERWDDIKSAIKRAVELINRFGINKDNLTSQNAVIPISYYFMENPGITLRGDSKFQVRTRRAIQRWFLTSLLNRTFSGTSDNVLRGIREVLTEAEDETFPLTAVNDELRSRGQLVGFNDETAENVLEYEKGGKRTFLALSLLYEPRDWGTLEYHQDHIFPSAKLSRDTLEERGFPEDRIDTFVNRKDKLANLQLLTAEENEAKQDQEFESWIQTRDDDFYDKHLIPRKSYYHQLENFDEFFEERQRLITDRLTELLT
jgi:hypothetical protein